ncbi:hypothetical protein ACFLQK_01745, partial [bacterium]
MKNIKLKKAIKIIKLVSLMIVISFTILVIHLKYFVRDIPSFDDSLLAIENKEIPEEENAFLVLVQIGGPIFDMNTYGEVFPEMLELEKNGELSSGTVEVVLSKYGGRFRAIDRAAAMKYSQAPLVSSPGDRIPNYLGLRMLAKLRLAVAWHDYKQGNVLESEEAIKNIFQMGKVLDSEDGNSYIISLFTGTYIKTDALRTLNKMFSEGYQPEDGGRKWIVFLSRFKFSDKSFKEMLKVEYSVDKNVIQDLGINHNNIFLYIDRKDLPWPLSNSFFRGMIIKEQRTKKYYYDYFSSYITAIDYTYSGINTQKIPEIELVSYDSFKALLEGDFGARIVMSQSTFDLGNFLKLKCVHDFAVDATRLRIAVLSFSSKNGDLPHNLVDLVPDYIDDVPLDPIHGMPISYNREKGVIYSYGEDNKDDGGTAEIYFPTEKKWKRLWEEKDIVLRIFEEDS